MAGESGKEKTGHDALTQDMKLRYEIPQGFSDEIKWFKFFSMRSLIVLIATAAPGIFLIRFFSGLGITLYLIVFWTILTGTVTGLTMFRMPSSNWLGGGGEYIDQVIIKRFVRRKSRCLYLKGYNQFIYEAEEKCQKTDKEVFKAGEEVFHELSL